MINIYLLFITLGLCVGYFIFIALIPHLFNTKVKKNNKIDVLSVFFISTLSLLSYWLVDSIENIEFANRVLHFSGSFIAFAVCFLVVRNTNLSLNRIQFFIFCGLIVTTLGVANEIVEFVLQNYYNFVAATSINDTWFDLISNTVGLLVAGIIFTPFIPCEKEHSELSQ